MPLSHACLDAKTFLTRESKLTESTAAQQPDDKASEDPDSRQDIVGLVTDLLFCVKWQDFFALVSMVMSLTVTPGTALRVVLQSSVWQIYHHWCVSWKSLTAS